MEYECTLAKLVHKEATQQRQLTTSQQGQSTSSFIGPSATMAPSSSLPASPAGQAATGLSPTASQSF